MPYCTTRVYPKNAVCQQLKQAHSLGSDAKSNKGIVSKRKDSLYRSGRSKDWLKMKNPACEAVKREAEKDWGR